jgi:hypothetical protein
MRRVMNKGSWITQDGKKNGIGHQIAPDSTHTWIHQNPCLDSSSHRANNQTPKTRSALHDVVTREYTIHLHKRVHDCQFKKSMSTPTSS